jgi:hypothetical protein
VFEDDIVVKGSAKSQMGPVLAFYDLYNRSALQHLEGEVRVGETAPDRFLVDSG